MRAGLHDAILARDGRCILAILFGDSHTCRDRWGAPQRADELDKLTVEHVREHPGGRRRDDYGWLVAMCHYSNVQHHGAVTETRRLINAYLLGVRAEGDTGWTA